MKYVGLDRAYRSVQWCALSPGGEVAGEGRVDARIAPLEAELRPFAHADPRAALLDTIPGVAELLALTIAVEISEISRFASRRSSSPTADSLHASASRAKLAPAAARSASQARACSVATGGNQRQID